MLGVGITTVFGPLGAGAVTLTLVGRSVAVVYVGAHQKK